jgi:hypothetical protein
MTHKLTRLLFLTIARLLLVYAAIMLVYILLWLGWDDPPKWTAIAPYRLALAVILIPTKYLCRYLPVQIIATLICAAPIIILLAYSAPFTVQVALFYLGLLAKPALMLAVKLEKHKRITGPYSDRKVKHGEQAVPAYVAQGASSAEP